MAFKVIVLCVSAFLIQTISSQCIGNTGASLAGNGYGLANGLPNGLSNNYISSGLGLGSNYAAQNAPIPTSGGSFVVTSSSPIAPTGISILAENLLIEGPLEVVGSLPLLGTVAVEGAVPTGGQAGVSYGCGNGNVRIESEFGAGGASSGSNGLGTSYGSGLNAAQIGAGIGGSNLAGLNAAQVAAGIGANNLAGAGLGLGSGYGSNRIL